MACVCGCLCVGVGVIVWECVGVAALTDSMYVCVGVDVIVWV